MKKLVLIIFFSILIVVNASNWKNTGNIGFSLTQAARNKMWAGGEQNSITSIATMNNSFVYDSEKLNFKNNLQLQFGRSSTPNIANPPYHIVTEAVDKIYFNSTLTITFNYSLF